MKNKYLISKERCKSNRKRILDISQKVNAIHAAGHFYPEIVDVIYYFLMKKKNNKFFDTFLMSKVMAAWRNMLHLKD